MPDQQVSELARAVQDITEKAQLLVHDEIELAKAELTEKITKLLRGAVFGLVAGIFAVFALVYLLHALSWGLWDVIGNESNFWLGFLITGALILILGIVAGLIAVRLIKKGTPPVPELAIEEAQLIKGTLTGGSSGPQGAVAPAAAQAPAEARR